MILVTGATGHVGNVLIRKLLEKKEEVRALIHIPTVSNSLDDLTIEKVKGDILDYHSLLNAFEGVETVYHCAAMISIMPTNFQKMYEINVVGTENVMKAAFKKGVKKVVYVSSIEAIGDVHPKIPVSEKDGFNPDKAMLKYGITKAKAALKVKEFAKQGLNVSIVCPVGIIGPYDFKPSQMGQMLIDFATKKLPAYPNYGGFDFVDVRDVADGIILADKKGKKGEHYILTSNHIKMSELMNLLEEITNKPKPKIKLPFNFMYFSGFFAEKFYAILKKEAVITRDSATILKSDLLVDGSKAKEDLGFSPRPLKESFKAQFEWFKKENYI